ncbi:hypothetical protein [Rivihabitans pingtungensis]|uniref:BRCT domain-containing protein n=1 Tax=Rivihabitans pingtungensis TaxID=1054498 RepID=A0A318KTV9_9NEIS|nr:hypothetical protein [Rivihabitans pingtungensis]PXX79135.1 hypothetical protein DFR34_10825 [Rivihabitans pingtungensis]
MMVDVIIGTVFWVVVIAWYLRRRRRKSAHVQPSSTASTSPSPNNPESALHPVAILREQLRQHCRSILADGLVEEDELVELHAWLSAQPALDAEPSVRRLSAQLGDALAKGALSTGQRQSIEDQLQNLAGIRLPVRTHAVRPASRTALPYLEGRQLDTVRFAYIDATGEYSDRRVVVRQLDGLCFQGLCLSRRATRTFRLDRVQGDITSEISGEVQEPWAWARDLAKPKSKPAPGKPAPQTTPAPAPAAELVGEVLFTGFARAERDALEQLADAHRWRVRKSITKNLTVLVAGPRAGEAKLAQARAAGVQVMDRGAFELLCK